MKRPRCSVCAGFQAPQLCSPMLHTDTALCHLLGKFLLGDFIFVNVMMSFVLLNVCYYYDTQTPLLSQIDSLLFVSKNIKDV